MKPVNTKCRVSSSLRSISQPESKTSKNWKYFNINISSFCIEDLSNLSLHRKVCEFCFDESQLGLCIVFYRLTFRILWGGGAMKHESCLNYGSKLNVMIGCSDLPYHQFSFTIYPCSSSQCVYIVKLNIQIYTRLAKCMYFTWIVLKINCTEITSWDLGSSQQQMWSLGTFAL